ncbi:hypothetical protein Tco_0063430, partial [Tanacetum coccineum]
MVSNIGNAKKFLMYPRFLQTILGIETSITRQYHAFKLSSKLFANMKFHFVRPSMPLLVAMLSQAQDGEGAGAYKLKMVKLFLRLGVGSRSTLSLHIPKHGSNQETRKEIMVCSFMLCDLDFEPLSLSSPSLPSCDLV